MYLLLKGTPKGKKKTQKTKNNEAVLQKLWKDGFTQT